MMAKRTACTKRSNRCAQRVAQGAPQFQLRVRAGDRLNRSLTLFLND
jgi:hypothetical protein